MARRVVRISSKFAKTSVGKSILSKYKGATVVYTDSKPKSVSKKSTSSSVSTPTAPKLVGTTTQGARIYEKPTGEKYTIDQKTGKSVPHIDVSTSKDVKELFTTIRGGKSFVSTIGKKAEPTIFKKTTLEKAPAKVQKEVALRQKIFTNYKAPTVYEDVKPEVKPVDKPEMRKTMFGAITTKPLTKPERKLVSAVASKRVSMIPKTTLLKEIGLEAKGRYSPIVEKVKSIKPKIPTAILSPFSLLKIEGKRGKQVEETLVGVSTRIKKEVTKVKEDPFRLGTELLVTGEKRKIERGEKIIGLVKSDIGAIGGEVSKDWFQLKKGIKKPPKETGLKMIKREYQLPGKKYELAKVLLTTAELVGFEAGVKGFQLAKAGVTRLSPKFVPLKTDAFGIQTIKGVKSGSGKVIDIDIARAGGKPLKFGEVKPSEVVSEYGSAVQEAMREAPIIPKLQSKELKKVIGAVSGTDDVIAGSYAQTSVLKPQFTRDIKDIDVLSLDREKTVDRIIKALGKEKVVIKKQPTAITIIEKKTGKDIADVVEFAKGEGGFVTKFPTIDIGKGIKVIDPRARLGGKSIAFSKGIKLEKTIGDIQQITGKKVSLTGQQVKGPFGASFREQAQFVGKELDLVTAQQDLLETGIFGKLSKKPISLGKGRETLSLREQLFYASPPDVVTGRPQLRVSRLGIGEDVERGSLLDFLSGKAQVRGKPQAVLLEKQTVSGIPKHILPEYKAALGKDAFTPGFIEKYSKFEKVKTGKFKPFGMPTGELEVVATLGERLLPKKKIGVTLIGGKRLNIYSAELGQLGKDLVGKAPKKSPKIKLKKMFEGISDKELGLVKGKKQVPKIKAKDLYKFESKISRKVKFYDPLPDVSKAIGLGTAAISKAPKVRYAKKIYYNKFGKPFRLPVSKPYKKQKPYKPYIGVKGYKPYTGDPSYKPYVGKPSRKPYVSDPTYKPYVGTPSYKPYLSDPFYRPPITTRKKKAVVKKIKLEPKPKKKVDTKSTYDTLILSQGNWKRLNKPTEKRNIYSAIKLGGRAVDHSAARSFKVRKGKGKAKIVQKSLPKNLNKFYQPSKTKALRLKEAFIEKSKFAIDSQGELQGITAKGWYAKKTKRKKKIKTKKRSVLNLLY